MSGPVRPGVLTDAPLYSNLDHGLDRRVALQLRDRPGELCAQHAAWNFCGYVWRGTDDKWHEEVWVHKSPRAIRSHARLEDLIAGTNAEYGHD